MSRLRSVAVRPPVSVSVAVPLAIRFAVLGCALLLTGCASKQAAAPQVEVAPARVARVEIEDDGLPAQLAPRNRRPGADDPTQPWSPNYGTDAPTEKRRAAAVVPPSRQAAVAPPQPIDNEAALAAARQVLKRMQQPQQPAALPDTGPQSAPNSQVPDQAAALAQARRVLATLQVPNGPTQNVPPQKAPATRLSGVDEDTLVRRAIAEHEMRRAD